MDLGKIGDRNVEFFKGRPSVFCATKSVQPFKSYDRSKIGKGEKEHKYMKNLIYIHVNMSLSLFLVFFPSWCLLCWVGCSPVSLIILIWAKKTLRVAKNGQNREMTTFFKHFLIKFLFTCSYTLIKPQQRGNWCKENSSEVLLTQCRPKKSGQNWQN